MVFYEIEKIQAGVPVYDIHCHIVPNIDDGSGGIADSVEMAQLAAKSGVRGIIATPHSNVPGMYENYWSEKLNCNIDRLNSELKKRNIPITLYPGQEVYAHGVLTALLKEGKVITLNNSNYLLLEFDFGTPEATALEYINSTVAEGYVPIIAHPERYGFIQENPEAVLNLRSSGALLQLNAGSITGEFGFSSMRVSRFILENRLADFVASDAHSQYSRTPDLTGAHEIVCGYFGYDYADRVFKENPLSVINNKEIR